MSNEINPENLIQEALKKYPDLADDTTKYVMYCVQVVENIKKEIAACDDDYDRYQIPCDWNNIGISSQVSTILEIVIGIKKLQVDGQIQKAWVIDVDAHKGDGTAEISEKDDSISTLSIHMAKGWPLDCREENSRSLIPSTVDIPIFEGEESEYLSRLEEGIAELSKLSPNPDLVVIVSGADPYELDELESSSLIQLSKEQMLNRDLFLYEYFRKENIAQTYLMAGGYGKESWKIYYQFLEQILKTHLVRK